MFEYIKNLKVKIANRKDSYNNSLGFINYLKPDGTWKFKKSYDNWEPGSREIEFVNEPISGFVINNAIGGYMRWGDGREPKIRIMDPRGFEVEVKIENFFIDILPYGVGVGKMIMVDLVYLFKGNSLYLVTPSSKEYQDSIKLSEDDLTEGGKYEIIQTPTKKINTIYKREDGKEFIVKRALNNGGYGSIYTISNILFEIVHGYEVIYNINSINSKGRGYVVRDSTEEERSYTPILVDNLYNQIFKQNTSRITKLKKLDGSDGVNVYSGTYVLGSSNDFYLINDLADFNIYYNIGNAENVLYSIKYNKHRDPKIKRLEVINLESGFDFIYTKTDKTINLLDIVLDFNKLSIYKLENHYAKDQLQITESEKEKLMNILKFK